VTATNNPADPGRDPTAAETATPDPFDDWRVWHRADRKDRWRVVATATTKAVAARMMFDLMTDRGGNWLVTAADAPGPNVRPAHLRR